MKKIIEHLICFLCVASMLITAIPVYGQSKDISRKQNVQSIAERLLEDAPVMVRIGSKDTMQFVPEGDRFIARRGNFEVILNIEKLTSVEGKRWTLHFTNKGNMPIDSLTIFPLYQTIGISDDKYADQPTVRWFSGSIWRDALYPPIAFATHEKRFLTNNNCGDWDVFTETMKTFKPLLEFGGSSSEAYIPMIQFSLRSGDDKVGCTALFEWSSKWKASASWTHITDEQLSSPSDFLLSVDYYLHNLTIEPGESLETPPVHLIYSRGKNWDAFTNDVHRYILQEIAPPLKNAPSSMPVSYDSWFGLAEHIDVGLLKKQVDKAAEIGCEYFTVDAGWSIPIWGSTTVDMKKFPNGIEEIAKYVRSKNMRFGLWTTLEHGEGRIDFHKPEVQKYHLENFETFVRDFGVEWTRLEGAGFPNGKNALKAHKDMQEKVYGKFIKNHPDFYIEGCQGGGRRLDLNMIRVTHGAWISDHTGEPDITRYNQTGALRALPARFLNMAVETHRNTGDSLANGHNILSRMVTVLSFDGDIAQWSPAATAKVKNCVDIYKQTRKHKEQPVSFPLPQPRNDSEWDAVVYGDGTGEAQLLFVFRMEGPAEQFMQIPDAPGKWKLLIDNGGAKMKQTENGYLISLNRNSSALWIREKR
jgi:hypothetical protein